MNPMDGVANLGSQEDDQKSTYDIHQLMSEISSKGVTIPHEKQHFNWDCGIACLRMVSSLDIFAIQFLEEKQGHIRDSISRVLGHWH